MDQREELYSLAQEQSQTLVPAHQVLEQTNQKVAQFVLGHQKKIAGKIAAAVDLGRFKIEHELTHPCSAEVMAVLKSNLQAAGYKVTPHQHTHNPVWTIAWDHLPTPGNNHGHGR